VHRHSRETTPKVIRGVVKGIFNTCNNKVVRTGRVRLGIWFSCIKFEFFSATWKQLFSLIVQVTLRCDYHELPKDAPPTNPR